MTWQFDFQNGLTITEKRVEFRVKQQIDNIEINVFTDADKANKFRKSMENPAATIGGNNLVGRAGDFKIGKTPVDISPPTDADDIEEDVYYVDDYKIRYQQSGLYEVQLYFDISVDYELGTGQKTSIGTNSLFESTYNLSTAGAIVKTAKAESTLFVDGFGSIQTAVITSSTGGGIKEVFGNPSTKRAETTPLVSGATTS